MSKDSYCGFCGASFSEDVVLGGTYPRLCGAGEQDGCGQITYNTPNVVSVVLVPVRKMDGCLGVVLVRRALSVGKGDLALPGGFVDGCSLRSERPRYSVQGQAVLEVLEETGIQIAISEMRELCTVGPTESNTILVFLEVAPILEGELPCFLPNNEVAERVVTYEPVELAFQAHSEVLRWFLAGKPGNIWDFSTVLQGYRIFE